MLVLVAVEQDAVALAPRVEELGAIGILFPAPGPARGLRDFEIHLAELVASAEHVDDFRLFIAGNALVPAHVPPIVAGHVQVVALESENRQADGLGFHLRALLFPGNLRMRNRGDDDAHEQGHDGDDAQKLDQGESVAFHVFLHRYQLVTSSDFPSPGFSALPFFPFE